MGASSPLARRHPATHKKYKRTWYGRKLEIPGPEDGSIPMDEKGLDNEDESTKWNESKQTRKTMLLAPLYNGLAAGLSLSMFFCLSLFFFPHISPVFIGNGIKLLFQEWTLDGGLTRFALLAVCPLLYCVALVRTLTLFRFGHELP